MDFGTHLMAGAIIAFAIPEATPEQRALVIAGSVLPDFICPLYFKALAKKVGKKLKNLVEQDAIDFGDKMKPWIPIYEFFHGLPFFILLSLVEWYLTGGFYFSAGWLSHLIYDLVTHHYPGKLSFCPKPFYPILNWTWKWGLTNGWKLKPKERDFNFQILIWFFHAVLLGFIFITEALP